MPYKTRKLAEPFSTPRDVIFFSPPLIVPFLVDNFPIWGVGNATVKRLLHARQHFDAIPFVERHKIILEIWFRH